MSSIYELANSPEVVSSIDRPSATRRYRVEGVSDELTVLSLAMAFAPATYLNLIREAIAIRPVEASGGTIWDVEAPYVRFSRQPLPVGEFRYSGKTTGGTRRMMQSLETKRVYDSAGPVLPGVGTDWFGSLIGVTSDGVEGTDIVSPNYEWAEEWTFLANSVTTAYIAQLISLTGSVNDTYFRGLDAGEALFMGADFSRKTGEHWSFVFQFRGSPNLAATNFGPFLSVTKDGWDYAWTFDTPSLNTAQQLIVRKPKLLMIEKVYYRRNYAGLGIGTGSLFA